MLSFKKERSDIKYRDIPISKISRNPHQPRVHFAESEIKSLAESIGQYGLLNPLTVREKGEGYELISGERRLRALTLLGVKSAPCHVISADDMNSARIALAENIVRQNLDFFEEATALKKLTDEFGMTQQEIAESIGRTQSAVANKIRLLRLCPETVEIIKKYGLTERHGRALLRVEDGIVQASCAEYIGKNGLNVEKAEKHIASVLSNMNKERKKRNTKVLVRDLRLFVNAVKNHVENLSQSGINADFSQENDGDYMIISVKIKK